MTIQPTNSALGAIVQDIDLSQTRDSETVSELQNAFYEYSLLIFSDQTLTEDEQVCFSKHFCNPEPHPTNAKNRGARPEITIISNTDDGALGNAEVHFHADLIFLPNPGTVSILYCAETPTQGGDTYWTGNSTAYNVLDDDMKQRLEGLEIAYVHARPEYNPPEPPRHPIVLTHPDTGRKSLYFSPNHAKWVEGLSKSESDETITFLTHYLTQEKFIHCHHWQPNDLVMWDNRSTMHRRDSFDNAQRRVMKRTQAVSK
ncbi:MAG: TauD/TfdA family dioxygenase [Candidatus Latescibacteria bacterium]|jgi:taurine dioxygenase|nr:TauD/TfdA family dioxygenase [Candidatus Latescibacterota bacterium]MBT4141146.1 TauD/TfdA family dioxygenase [Candidatus Latescibacterota bacterium]